MQNRQSHTNYKGFGFTIVKCISENKHKSVSECASDEQIKDYLSNIVVILDIMKLEVDFKKRGNNVLPVYSI